MGEPKALLLGCAETGAKFTPGNHQSTGNAMLDAILQGKHIPIGLEAILSEVEALYKGGVRYLHWHPRNPVNGEQSCDNSLFREFGLALRHRYPGLILSFGASRNGSEILSAIVAGGEWERMRQAAIPRHEGGADFVTLIAAAELKVIIDLEKQGYVRSVDSGNIEVLKSLDEYIANRGVEAVSIEANSTSGGANYGSSSAAEQLRAMSHAIAVRNQMNLPQEVEWTQLERSYGLTKLMLDHISPSLGGTGRLNVTLLFGFSPKMPFPLTYEEFRRVVKVARSLEQRSVFPQMHLSICVGAAVLPQHASELICPLDVGQYQGARVAPLERLVAYACQPDSDVDLLRFGLEDHPFLLDENHNVVPVTNLDLMEYVVERIEKHGGRIMSDPITVRHFVATECRPYQVDSIAAA